MTINKCKRFLLSKFYPSREVRRYHRFYGDDPIYRENVIKEFEEFNADILSLAQTLDVIKEKNLSATRFGDGEFICMCQMKGIRYQKSSRKLKKRLIEVANSQHEKLLVCMPPYGKKLWGDILFQIWSSLKKYLDSDKNQLMGNSYISRIDVFKSGLKEKWQAIFNQRKIVFVTGRNSRCDTNHELFQQAQSFQFIDAPATDAFADYDDIVQQCKTHDNDVLFLISLGPAATILAYDLCLAGYQAIDIGHITSCYDEYYYQKSAPEKMPVEIK